ncbi:MAG: cupin domain-containing protein [Candidatus Acidiferrum sp.]
MPNSNPQTIVRKPLLTALLEPQKLNARVEIKQIDFVAGQCPGLHFHPGPVVGYVAAGSVLLQIEGQEARTLHAGQAFFEPASTRILRFNNASASEPTTFIAFYLLGASEHELIHMLE